MSGAVAQSRRLASSPLKVVALTAGEVAGEWEFEKDVVTVGRGAGADIRFADNKKISRLHCVFEVREDGVWVKDANSVNGTWLNNRRITEAKVLAEDLVVVAGIRFRAMITSAAEERTPVEPSVSFFTAAAPAAKVANAGHEGGNVVPFRAPAPAPVTPAAPPVDTDRTKPEIRALEPEISLPEPERPAPVRTPPPVRAPEFTVGGKRRTGRAVAAPSQGLTSGQKVALVLAIGGFVAFGGLLVVLGAIAVFAF